MDQDGDPKTKAGGVQGEAAHTAPLSRDFEVNGTPLPAPWRQSSASEEAPFISMIWHRNSPQSVSVYKNVLEPLLIPESPHLPNLPDPPAPIQKPVVQVEVIHLVHENKPAGEEKGLEEEAGP